ncbi:MAG: hypothetical protein AVDCRST_MAG04-3612, partial [uncultured Acetobacteraceae bacterium]
APAAQDGARAVARTARRADHRHLPFAADRCPAPARNPRLRLPAGRRRPPRGGRGALVAGLGRPRAARRPFGGIGARPAARGGVSAGTVRNRGHGLGRALRPARVAPWQSSDPAASCRGRRTRGQCLPAPRRRRRIGMAALPGPAGSGARPGRAGCVQRRDRGGRAGHGTVLGRGRAARPPRGGAHRRTPSL